MFPAVASDNESISETLNTKHMADEVTQKMMDELLHRSNLQIWYFQRKCQISFESFITREKKKKKRSSTPVAQRTSA